MMHHMGNGTDEMMMMMQMTFYQSTEVTILFDWWKTDSVLTYSASLLLLFFFGLSYELLIAMRKRGFTAALDIPANLGMYAALSRNTRSYVPRAHSHCHPPSAAAPMANGHPANTRFTANSRHAQASKLGPKSQSSRVPPTRLLRRSWSVTPLCQP